VVVLYLISAASWTRSPDPDHRSDLLADRRRARVRNWTGRSQALVRITVLMVVEIGLITPPVGLNDM
jgi:hypothetical protein